MIGAGRIGQHPEPIAAIKIFPAVIGDAARIFAVTHPAAVVLQAAIDLIRVLVVDGDVVELADRQVARMPPFAAAIIADPHAAIVGTDQMLGVLGVHPHIVPIGMAAAGRVGEALAGIVRHDHAQVHLEHAIGVGGINHQLLEIEGTPHHVAAAVARFPALAAVFRHIKRGLGMFDHGIDAIWHGRGVHHLDAAPRALGQALGGRIQHLPRLAAIFGDRHGAARRCIRSFAAGTERPALAAEIPQAGDQAIRVGRIEADARTAGGKVGALQDLRPGLAAVAGLVEAAIRAVAPQRAGRAGIDDIAVGWVHHDLGDALHIGQAHQRPVVAAVGGLVDAVAHRNAVARPAFAGADPHGLLVGGIQCDGADRLHRLLVELGREAGAAIVGFPHAARGGAHEDGDLAIIFHARRQRRDAARHGGRTDVADAEAGNTGTGGNGAVSSSGGSGDGEGRCGQQYGADHGVVLPHLPGWANRLAGAATLALALAMMTRWRWLEPCGPLSIDIGNITPPTAS